MIHYLLDERHLDMLWIRYVEQFCAAFGVELDGLVVKDGECDGALVADEQDAVFACRLVRDETPRCRSSHAVVEAEACIECVFHLVEMSHVAAEALCLNDGTNHVLYHVELVTRQVIEVAATACHLGLKSPRHLFRALAVQLAWWDMKLNLHREQLANLLFCKHLLDLIEVGEVSAVERNETRHTCQLGDAVDTQTLLVVACQRLLYVAGFARTHSHDGVCRVRRGWGGDVYHVYFIIVNERLRIGVEFLYAVAFSI